jgi:hypothetical protein
MKAGVTGHQELGGASAERWVRGAVQRAVRHYQISYGYTCLAKGADQIFAEVLGRMCVPYSAIVPSRQYDTTFTTVAAKLSFQTLLAAASESIALEFSFPSEDAFFAGGQEVVSRADLIVAVWDGQPAKGRGGTGDIVALARENARRVIHLNPWTRSENELEW